MTPTKIIITLKSASTFGSGSGVPGLVDREIEHNENGFPFLRGKTLKGLLAESAENITFALEDLQKKSGWTKAKENLFGLGGAGLKERGILHIEDAQLPEALRAEILNENWENEDVLYSLTGIRRQTSINEHGAPDHATLRSMRVLLPGVTLEAKISFDREPSDMELQLLNAAVLDFRHAGTGRNRGRGWLKAELDDAQVTQKLFTAFGEAIK
jgi:CRISPR/Cas system CSM-associated protein Csm3 (group 7 of RAMP superfamily)